MQMISDLIGKNLRVTFNLFQVNPDGSHTINIDEVLEVEQKEERPLKNFYLTYKGFYTEVTGEHIQHAMNRAKKYIGNTPGMFILHSQHPSHIRLNKKVMRSIIQAAMQQE